MIPRYGVVLASIAVLEANGYLLKQGLADSMNAIMPDSTSTSLSEFHRSSLNGIVFDDDRVRQACQFSTIGANALSSLSLAGAISIIRMTRAYWPLCKIRSTPVLAGLRLNLLSSRETMCGTLMASTLRNRLSAVDEAQVSEVWRLRLNVRLTLLFCSEPLPVWQITS